MGNTAGLASTCVNQAFGYNLAGRHHAAIGAAQEALTLFQRLGEPAGRAVAAQNLAEAYLALQDLVMAETYARQVIAENDSLTLPDGLRVLGEVKLEQDDTTGAEHFFQESLNAARHNDDVFLEAYALRSLGKVYLVSNLSAEATRVLNRAIELFEQLELPHESAATQTYWGHAHARAS